MSEKLKLLEPVKIGKWNLRNRIVMAPMTRCFADNETGVISDQVISYYQRRARDGVGLIITEGINPSRRGKGSPGVPGLYTKDQVQAWKRVTDAVHAEGGTIIAQLWHNGRLTHSELTGGYPPLAPSKIKAQGLVHRLRKPYETPEEMSLEQIQETIQEFATAAKNAIEAGFDGVEIHGAHGYLIDQFNTEVTNQRTDAYGGTLTKRLRFMKEVLIAVGEAIGMEHVTIRFSELKNDLPDYQWPQPEVYMKAYLDLFKEVGVQTIHGSVGTFTEPFIGNLTFHQFARKYWDGYLIGVGALDAQTASKAIEEGTINLAAFGRPMIANPDFVQRIKAGKELIPYNPKVHLKELI